MNPVDIALQGSFPSMMVPTRESVAPMSASGERLLIASNGVFLEISRAWVRLVRRLSSFDWRTPVPYGEAAEHTDLLCGTVPAGLVAQFAELARAALPNEVGAWIVWDSATGEFRLVTLPSLSHGPGHLHYERPVLRASECLIVDCHSHGHTRAYFSPTDDRDDQHDVKFALVLGNCDRTPSVALRLCAKGRFEIAQAIPQHWLAALAGEVV
ncbi:PRTRC genetic system protein A [Paraburkholderia tropica]|uniref:PRTRC genetic system protein A n=1 Tax=Paraburkholderia tropica TaxID=92647 RepID=A0ABX5MCB6_9BURK|nr:PRTRC system protein A [Paraburkholderia tropica]MBB2984202.1 PRTRC genetic system protein A [Paraburkholderia tropica]MBB3004077.1 PRTRC genetic system protein A [Paraburkholderia tropica]MBB6323234.1 PRTRC genetic system protein A [Paraburkholderia tropica]PXX05685.1 PRTRC genetic system protein A [Paraburkholderia tropica]PZW70807.1 PRTRC genetic system protein A [Paraburkholderia tropica]